MNIIVLVAMIATTTVILGAVTVIGVLTYRRATEVELRVAGYLVAIVAGVLTILFPVWMAWSWPVSESNETHSEPDPVIATTK